MKRIIIAVSIIAVLVAALTAGLLVFRTHSDSVPPGVKRQLSFKAYVPSGDYAVVSGSVKYDSKQAVLTMKVAQHGLPLVVVTEQAYPDTLIYDKLISTMSAERQVGNGLGQATVTHPKSAPGKEVAVVQADTTLMFMSSDSKLNDSAWRSLLNSMSPLD